MRRLGRCAFRRRSMRPHASTSLGRTDQRCPHPRAVAEHAGAGRVRSWRARPRLEAGPTDSEHPSTPRRSHRAGPDDSRRRHALPLLAAGRCPSPRPTAPSIARGERGERAPGASDGGCRGSTPSSTVPFRWITPSCAGRHHDEPGFGSIRSAKRRSSADGSGPRIAHPAFHRSRRTPEMRACGSLWPAPSAHGGSGRAAQSALVAAAPALGQGKRRASAVRLTVPTVTIRA